MNIRYPIYEGVYRILTHHRPLNIINLLRNGLLVSIYRVDTDVPCQNRFSEPFDRENKNNRP